MTQDTGLELIDAIHASVKEAQSISYQLGDLSDALYRVGMTKIADEIDAIAARVLSGPEAVQRAYSGKLTDDLRHSEAVAGGLLKLALKGYLQPPKKERKP